MKRTLKERITDSFPEDDREGARQYLDWLRATLSDLSGSMRRTATLVISLIAVFEFIAGSPHASFVLAGFHVGKDSVVLQFIPALVAYFYFQMVVDTTDAGYVQAAFTHAMRCWSPVAEKNDLDVLIKPVQPLYWSPYWARRDENEYRTDIINQRASDVFAVAILAGTLAFEGQAYYVLLSGGRSIISHIIWASSLFVTLFCLAMAFIYIRVYDSTVETLSSSGRVRSCFDLDKVRFSSAWVILTQKNR